MSTDPLRPGRPLRGWRTSLRRSTLPALLAALACGQQPALAQGFAAYVSPPRIVAQVQPGQTLRDIIEIQHVGRIRGSYRIYTNDWDLQGDQSVRFTDDLLPDSCRPWVAVERRELSLDPNARYRYRFEVTPPADTPVRECRFALMVEGLDPTQVRGSLNFPVGGRIAVIVYLSVGAAAPALVLQSASVATLNGQPTPVLNIRNEGTAHGRLDGVVTATDADGNSVELVPADAPILPGQTRSITLSVAVEPGQTPPPPLRFPLQVKGTLEWGREALKLDHRFAP